MHISYVIILWDNFKLISPPIAAIFLDKQLHGHYVHYKCVRIEYF